ncbi:uncharacterized protein LOC131061466 [Cryptomeria japonica]|uniref:uncharacterized protein LOC131061466 n=1 Tax=Cryptomeria japonica TaxID=3369 RepID=UPI0027DA275F|nr:uncharacterized protein LOC131061466 [Cryptomeria japonica]
MEWANSSHQEAAMLLLDFEKAYDRIEWDFILMMLKAFGFPDIFCKYIQILLKDASAMIDVNGSLTNPIPLSRSIRQGCPLAPALFVIASDALHYILKDDTISPKVRGITLPNDSELLNIQFADDISLFLELSYDNLICLCNKLDMFGKASGAHISSSKSIMLGWSDHPPDWLCQFSYSWGGPNQIVRYLGIPFSVKPSLKDMWLWIKDKIFRKLNKWNHRLLSLAGRVQKAIRHFLWSDGNGSRKAHSVKWDWCHLEKSLGGLGLKDLKLQGMALSSKWILQSLVGDEPWKVLVRNDIQNGVPKTAKSWKHLPFSDLVFGNFPISVKGTWVFHSLWKAWENIRHYIDNSAFDYHYTLQGERSIWWNLLHQGKPLALTKGCSAKFWANKGVKYIMDILDHNQLISWEDLANQFDIPASHKRMYNLIKMACSHLNLPRNTDVDSHRFLSFRRQDGTHLSSIKAKDIYRFLNHDTSVSQHLNVIWYSSFSSSDWHKMFDKLWKAPIPPKIQCFKWLLLLDRLPIRNQHATLDICSICRVPETMRHIFFDCSFAHEGWLMFGICITRYVCCVLNLEKRKLLRFLRDGRATMFIYEMQNGYELASVLDNQMAFDEALAKLMQEIQNSKNPSVDNLQVFHQLLEQKKAIWMEGPIGWTSWVNKFEDVYP